MTGKWKLASASNSKHIFSEGNLIRIRSGNHVRVELTLVRCAGGYRWREEGGAERWYGWAREPMTRQSMGEMGDFYGRTVDLWVEDPTPVKETEPEVTCNVKEVPANTKVLVGKQFTKLVDGLRLEFKRYDNYPCEPHKFEAIVSRHGGTRFQVIQVHIIRDGKSFSTVSFRENLDNLTVQDITFFNKYSCYLVKNYQKESKTAKEAAMEQVRLCPNGAKAIPERDDEVTVVTKDDALGKYIIWCPTAEVPPRNINTGQRQAKAIAATMSERYGKTFYWARLMGKVEQKVTTVTNITKM